MTRLPPLHETCIPRPQEQTSRDYAADLHRALNGEIGTAAHAADFFASTYATPAMRRVATHIFDRLRYGAAANQPAVIRFNSIFGGGKTHTLIALAAAAKHPQLVRDDAASGLIPSDLAVDDVQLVCFTGENADVLRGMAMDGTDHRAKSLTGFLAYYLGGASAFDELKAYDDLFTDPGADGFQRLIGDRPTLILIDELVRWVAAVEQLDEGHQKAGDGLRNALTAIAKAVTNSPRAVLVITTPEQGHDAYREETRIVHSVMDNVNSVIARIAQDYTPTDTADFPAILRRRLFSDTGSEEHRQEVAQAYAAVWRRYNPQDTAAEQRFYACYPFHPETLRIITERLASNNDFQRVRGALRTMAAVIHHQARPIKEPLLHPYHIDVTIDAVREELVHRLKHSALEPAIVADVTEDNATAQRYGPTTRQAANIILLGSLAPIANNGLANREIVNGLISPAQPDDSVAMQAIRNMQDNGLYIDDDPSAVNTRFNQQANVRREVEQRAAAISESAREDGIRNVIQEAFYERDGMGVHLFPSRQNNVPDDPNTVHVGILHHNYVTWQSSDLDKELGDLYNHNSGNGGNAPREYRNNVVFLVPEHDDLTDVKQQMARHKAAEELLQEDRGTLLEYQHKTLKTIARNSRKAVFQGIQRTWIHLYYPEPAVQPHGLQNARLHFPDQEGKGQRTLVAYLTGSAVAKMADPRSPALAPQVWADAGLQAAEDKGMTVGELHDRFTRTPSRPMFLQRAHFEQALRQTSESEAVAIRTPTDLPVSSAAGISYRNDMRVWLTEYAPPPPPLPCGTCGKSPCQCGRPPNLCPRCGAAPCQCEAQLFFSIGEVSGKVAVAELGTWMQSHKVDWSNLVEASLHGNDIRLLNDMASKAQSNGIHLDIRYEFSENGIELSVTDQTAAEWQEKRRVLAQLERTAAPAYISATVIIQADDNEAEAGKKMLHDLDNTHQVQLDVYFRQPADPTAIGPGRPKAS